MMENCNNSQRVEFDRDATTYDLIQVSCEQDLIEL